MSATSEQVSEIRIGDGTVDTASYIGTYRNDEATKQAVFEKVIAMSESDLWSFFRSLISQGALIRMDYATGKYANYEELSARLDAAARERVKEFTERFAP